MDYLDLKVWLDLWKEESRKLMEVESEFKKLQKKKELLSELTNIIEGKLSSVPLLIKNRIKDQLIKEFEDVEKNLYEEDKEIQSKKAEMILIEEKLKIIKGKLKNAGIDVYQQMIENLRGTII